MHGWVLLHLIFSISSTLCYFDWHIPSSHDNTVLCYGTWLGWARLPWFASSSFWRVSNDSSYYIFFVSILIFTCFFISSSYILPTGRFWTCSPRTWTQQLRISRWVNTKLQFFSLAQLRHKAPSPINHIFINFMMFLLSVSSGFTSMGSITICWLPI